MVTHSPRRLTAVPRQDPLREIGDLREKLADAEARIRELESASDQEYWSELKHLGLTKTERRIFCALTENYPQPIFHDRMFQIAYGDDQLRDGVNIKSLHVIINKIRRKLERHNSPWHIDTLRGEGHVATWNQFWSTRPYYRKSA